MDSEESGRRVSSEEAIVIQVTGIWTGVVPMEWWKGVIFCIYFDMQQVWFLDWLDVGCDQRKAGKDVYQAFGLSNGKDRVALTEVGEAISGAVVGGETVIQCWACYVCELEIFKHTQK